MDDAGYKARVVDLIRERYSVDDEIALINNRMTDPEVCSQEWDAYQIFRQQCKEQARKESL